MLGWEIAGRLADQGGSSGNNPPIEKAMNRQPMYVAGSAALLLMLPLWTDGVRAGGITPLPRSVPGMAEVEYPLNRDCTVTVDSRSAPKPRFAGQAKKITGFVAPDTAEGILIRLDDDWLVLRDGSEENWIPKEKVLMIRVTR